jgi:diacylglycerol O-acyltransferase
MSPEPAGVMPPPAEQSWSPDDPVSRSELIAAARRERSLLLRKLPHLLRLTVRGLRAASRQRRAGPVDPPLPMLRVPWTSFNGTLTARRRFVSVSLPLDDIKLVREAYGVTVNDVLLGLVAGSLRRYLADRGEAPRRSLVAEVPVSTDRRGEPRRLAGNRLANIFTSLCTDVDHPAERLRRIHLHMQIGKHLNQALGPDLFRQWTEHMPPRLFVSLVRQYVRFHIADLHPPPVNVIVSSVPGPRQPLYWTEGHLHQLYSVGPLVESVGLNVTAWSYVDRLNIGLLSCPDRLSELERVADGLSAALSELLHAAAPARSA